MRALLLPLVMVTLSACGGPLGEGESLFGKGRYPEAKQALVAIEAESRGWSDARRAEYALYRGLTLGALGDRGRAAVWLREAKAIEDTHPGALSEQDARRLHIGLESHEGE